MLRHIINLNLINMKKAFLKTVAAALFIATAMPSSAADLLTVTGSDGTPKKVELAQIQKVHFEGEKMVITHSEGTHEVSLDGLQLSFDEKTSTGIISDANIADDIAVTIANGNITITAQNDKSFNVFVYSLQGQTATAIKGNGTITLDTNSLSKGAYILKVNDKVYKFIR